MRIEDYTDLAAEHGVRGEPATTPRKVMKHSAAMSHAELLAAAAKTVVETHRDGIDPGWHWTLPEKYREGNRG